jgi:hypothetical protein
VLNSCLNEHRIDIFMYKAERFFCQKQPTRRVYYKLLLLQILTAFIILKTTWCTFHSVYWESMASTCFEHYLLMLRRCFTNGIWYIACVVMSVGCSTVAVKLQPCAVSLQPGHSQLTPPEDGQIMLETCTGPWISINWIKSASRWFYYADLLCCSVRKTLRLTVLFNLITLQQSYVFGLLICIVLSHYLAQVNMCLVISVIFNTDFFLISGVCVTVKCLIIRTVTKLCTFDKCMTYLLLK